MRNSLIVDVFSLAMIEDDIEYDNDDDDTFDLTITTALTASCIVIQDHISKRKHRLNKKKGRGCPFTISRQRMSILLIRRLLSDPCFKRSYRFSPHEIENLIQCIGPYVVVAPTGKTTAPNGIIPLETKVLATIRFFLQVAVPTIYFHCLGLDTLHYSDVFGQLCMQLTRHQT